MNVTDGGGIRALLARLEDANPIFQIDEPKNPAGESWLDIEIDGYATSVSWHPHRGFGIYTSDNRAYGARPDELYPDPDEAALRLRMLVIDNASGNPRP